MIAPNNIKDGNAELIRKIPYPYLAGLSISNDAEYMSERFLEDLMPFINTTNNTALGSGLGLEVTNSIFFYTAHPYSFSYFSSAEVKSKKSLFSRRIDEYLQSGWIDTIHAFGDFDKVGGFVRAHAEKVFETLAKLNVRLQVYTNHGDSLNHQNIGGDANYHKGDVIGSSCYHSDLLQQNGMKFIWTDTAVDHIAKKKPTFNLPFTRKNPQPLLEPWKLQDGNTLTRFKRFRGTGSNAPNLSSLGYQISQIDIQNLYATKGLAIIYQHLGVLYRANGKCYPASLEDLQKRPEVYLAPWYLLSRESKEGRLWIAGLSRFLNYAEMIQNVEINKIGTDTIKLICNHDVKDPTDYFQGLTIYIDTNSTPKIMYKEKMMPLAYNGPDETGKYSISIPFKKLDNIW